MITMTREPESLRELYNEIVAQLKEGEVVEITLTEGDCIYELLESMSDGMEGTRHLNEISRPYVCVPSEPLINKAQ